jgi:hypothetical protein
MQSRTSEIRAIMSRLEDFAASPLLCLAATVTSALSCSDSSRPCKILPLSQCVFWTKQGLCFYIEVVGFIWVEILSFPLGIDLLFNANSWLILSSDFSLLFHVEFLIFCDWISFLFWVEDFLFLNYLFPFELIFPFNPIRTLVVDF